MSPSSSSGRWRRFRAHRGARVGLVVLALIGLGGLLAGVLAPFDPTEQFRDALLQAPSWRRGGHLLGTDELGRDVLARLLHGTRYSIGLAAGAVVLAAVPGALLGLCAAFEPRVVGVVVARSADVLLAVPSVLLAITVVAVLGPGLVVTLLAVAVATLPGYVRLARACALGELARPYVTAARAIGAGTPRLMFSTVLPNCLGPLLVAATLDFSSAMLTAAGLGFLGLGAQPPTPEWGAMLAGARDHLGRAAWLVLAPGAAILATVACATVVGDALRDALDPRSTGLRRRRR